VRRLAAARFWITAALLVTCAGHAQSDATRVNPSSSDKQPPKPTPVSLRRSPSDRAFAAEGERADERAAYKESGR
jgi:hypothetical protein